MMIINRELSADIIKWKTLKEGTWKKYIIQFGLFHTLKTKGVSGIQDVCLDFEYMSKYIQISSNLITPLKFLRIIGMEQYISSIQLKLNSISLSVSDSEKLINILNFIIQVQEPTKNFIQLFEHCFNLFEHHNMNASSKILIHKIMGVLYRKINKFEQGQYHLQKAIQLGTENNLLLNHHCMEARQEFSFLVQITGQYEKGLNIMREIFEEAQTNFGPKSELTLSSQLTLGWYAHHMSKLEESEEIYRPTLNFIEQEFGVGHPLYMRGITEYADLLKTKGNRDKAYAILKQTRKTVVIELGTKTNVYIQVSNFLGVACLELDKYEEAKEIFNYLIELQKMQAVPIPMYHVNLAVSHMMLEEYAQAETEMNIATELAAVHWPSGSLDYLILKQNMARLQMKKENFHESIKTSKELLELQQAHLGPEHHFVVASYATLAYLYSCIGDASKSYHFHEQTYLVGQKTLGKGHTYISDAVYEMSNFYYELDDFDSMEQVLADGCDTLLNGEEELDESNVFNVFLLGRLKLTLGKCEESINIFTKILQYKNESFGLKSNETARTHNYLAKSHVELKQYTSAIEHRTICFEIHVQYNGMIHPDTISVGLDLVQDYRHSQNQELADSLLIQLKQALNKIDQPDDVLLEKLKSIE